MMHVAKGPTDTTDPNGPKSGFAASVTVDPDSPNSAPSVGLPLDDCRTSPSFDRERVGAPFDPVAVHDRMPKSKLKYLAILPDEWFRWFMP
jgi:hypothetical protein